PITSLPLLVMFVCLGEVNRVAGQLGCSLALSLSLSLSHTPHSLSLAQRARAHSDIIINVCSGAIWLSSRNVNRGRARSLMRIKRLALSTLLLQHQMILV